MWEQLKALLSAWSGVDYLLVGMLVLCAIDLNTIKKRLARLEEAAGVNDPEENAVD